MICTPENVRDVLAGVRDPISARSIVDTGLLQKVEISGTQVNISLEIGNLDAQQKADLNFACMLAIQEAFEGMEANVHLVTRAASAQPGQDALPQVRNVIAVASGKGGVGKSTVSVNLALALKQLGARVGLIDADLYGPSIPTMLHLQDQRPKVQEIYGKPRLLPLDAYGIPVISIGNIVEPEQAVVLRGPRLAGIIKQFIQETIWPELDYLVLDLPPGTGDIQLTLVQTVPITGVVLVTTPQEVAVADAVKAMNMFLLPQINVPILGVVENMSWFTPAELPGNKYYLFGQGGGARLAKASESMLLGQVPLFMSIREGGDTGRPAVLQEADPGAQAFLRIAENVARQVALRNETLAPTRIVQVNS